MTHARRRMKRFTVVGGAGLAVAVLLAFAGTAAAKVIGQEHYSGTDSFSFDDCGFTFDVASTFSGVLAFRVDKGGEAFLVRDNYQFRDVVTNRSTGKWFVVRGNAIFHEIKTTHVSGTVYEFEAIEAGQPLVIEDAAGNLVFRDRGVVRRTALFDTLGDGEPGGVLLEETHVSLRGPHPSFGEVDFCEIVTELTG